LEGLLRIVAVGEATLWHEFRQRRYDPRSSLFEALLQQHWHLSNPDVDLSVFSNWQEL
jgi:hypothetical protein